MSSLQKVKLIETKLVLWEVEFTFHQFYDKNSFSPQEAVENFKSITDGLEPYDFEENEDDSDDNWYLTTEVSYYACDSGHGANIVNDCLVAMADDGIKLDEIEDYDYQWNKLDISINQEYIQMGLSTYSNEITYEDGFLVGTCFSEFIDNCSCKECS